MCKIEREKVARLEAANEAKDAALRELMNQAGHGGRSVECVCGGCKQARAALSPDAGEGWEIDDTPGGPRVLKSPPGWLPPEVREQVDGYLCRIKEHDLCDDCRGELEARRRGLDVSATNHSGSACDTALARAALDALGGT